jgi:hypothetical protein
MKEEELKKKGGGGGKKKRKRANSNSHLTKTLPGQGQQTTPEY